MKIVLDTQKLKEVITSFAEITRTNICFFDADMNVLAALPQKMQPFCRRIREAEGKLKLCLLSDETHRRQVKKLKKPVTYTCHAGLTETMLPVIYDEEIIGYIIFGQYRGAGNEDASKAALAAFCNKNALDHETLLAEYEKLPRLSPEQVKASVAMMELCIKYLRVKAAEELLIVSDKPVSEIAADVGYSDYNYFIKVFKKATGVTPLKYRKQNS